MTTGKKRFKPGDLVVLQGVIKDVALITELGSRKTHGTMIWPEDQPGILLELHSASSPTSPLWDVLLPNGIGRCNQHRLVKV